MKRSDKTVFSWNAPDNGDYMLRKCADVARCPACKVALNKFELDYSDISIKGSRWDVTETYDGFKIVSPRFAAIGAEHGFQGYELRPLKKGGFVFLSNRVLRVDIERSKQTNLRFGEFCETCRRYNSVACGTLLFLETDQDVSPDSFYRTDIFFAWRDEQHPVNLCGVEVADVLRRLKIRGPAFKRKHISF